MPLKIKRNTTQARSDSAHSNHVCMAVGCRRWGSLGYAVNEAGIHKQLWFCPEHAREYEADVEAAKHTPPPPLPPKQGRLV